MRDWDDRVDGDIEEHRRRHRLPLKFRRSKRGDTLFVDVQVHQRPTFNRPRPTPPENVTGYFFWLTVKRNLSDPDSAAIAQVTNSSSTPAGGTFKLVSPPLGQVEFSVPPAATTGLAPFVARLFYDVQLQDFTGAIRTVEEGIWEVDGDVTETTVAPAPTPPTPINGVIFVAGPATVVALPNAIYVTDVTGGNVVIDVPALGLGQTVGVIPALGDYGAHSVTVTSLGGQLFALPPPDNTLAPIGSYVFGAGGTSGGGALDKGGGITWINGGAGGNLSIFGR